MLKKELEGIPSQPAGSIMRDQEQHCNGLHGLPRRHNSLATSHTPREKVPVRRMRSNSICTAAAILPISRPSLDSSKTTRRPSVVSRSKEHKDSSSAGSAEQHSFVVLGVGAVGKTALIVRYVTGRFLHEYDPTLEMTYEKEICIGDNTVSLSIMDTAGNGEASYIKQGDGFIVVYSITDYYSFEVARQLIKLIKQVRRTDDVCQVPIVLVGNKRDSRRGRCVSKSEAREVASEYGCSHYETSALTNRNVNVVFYNMIFQVRFTKASNRESKKSSPSSSATPNNNGFLSSVKQLFNTGGRAAARRGSLPP